MPKKYKYRTTFTVDGKRYSVYADAKKELIEKEIRKKIEIETHGQVVDSSMTLKDWASRCVDTYKTDQKEITRKKYINRMNHCILEPIGHMKLKDIKPLHCQEVINQQIGNSKTQINAVYQTMNFLFRHAVENGLLRKNPAEHIVRPKGTRSHRRALTAHERRFFIQVGLQDRRYYYFLLMLFCGCRPSEASAAMGGDIRILSNGLPALHIRGTKTDNADRLVPIPDEFYQRIKEIPGDEYIAQTQRRGKIGGSSRMRIWNSYTRQINLAMGCKTYRNALVPPYPLAPDLVPYCLRHEYCTELARQGVDIRTAQKLMGHSDIRLTANIYTNLNSDDVANVAAYLSQKGSTVGSTSKGVEKGVNGVSKQV